MDELLQQFVIEAIELTQQAADDLLALEREPGHRGHTESAFRAIHTLKGSVALFELAPMHAALHAAEDVLGAADKDGGEIEPSRIDPLIEIVEWIDRCVRQLARTGDIDPDAGDRSRELVAGLGRAETVNRDLPLAPPSGLPPWAAVLFAQHDAAAACTAIRYAPRADCFYSGDDPIALMASLPSLIVASVSARDPWPSLAELDPFRSNLIFEALSGAPRSEIEAVFRLVPDQVAIVARPEPETVRRSEAEEPSRESARTIRVDIDRIDQLMDTVGELFAAKNALSDLIDQSRAIEGGSALALNISVAQQELDRLASRIQRATTSVRMVPLNETFRRLPRLVREVASRASKQADLVIDGGEIEADRSIVDGLYEPLLHVIRNAIDHGMEPGDDRVTAGKPERGSIHVRARQAGHRIEIAISDDGRGIDAAHIRALGVARGLITAAEAKALGDEGALDLLFRSGFSTASNVTELSGRGVGMDAVRISAQRLGGNALIRSSPGQGTTVSLLLPTTLTVTRMIEVAVTGQAYGLLIETILETTRLPSHSLVSIRAGEAFVWRERTVPVVRLAALVGLASTRRGEELVIVAEIAGSPVGVIVDSIGDMLDAMLRPPAGLLRSVAGLLGTTVLRDGRILMALDLETLIR